MDKGGLGCADGLGGDGPSVGEAHSRCGAQGCPLEVTEYAVFERKPPKLFPSQISTTCVLMNQYFQPSLSDYSVLGPRDPEMRNNWPHLIL